VAAYADASHVKARAGYLGGAWTEESEPAFQDLDGFVREVADEINAAISGLGYTLPTDGSAAALALRGMNADGALLIALDATYPAGDGPQAATQLQERIERRYEKAWERLLAGQHPATTVSEVSDSAAAGATDFWQENPDYGLVPADVEDVVYPNPYLDPAIWRGMPL
jgi:hypothetical protein